MVQGRIEGLLSTFLPHLHVFGIGASAALHLGLLFYVHGFLLIFLIVRGILQSLQVVDLHATQLVELEAAVLPGSARVIRRQSAGHVLPNSTREAQEHQESSEGHGWAMAGNRADQERFYRLRAQALQDTDLLFWGMEQLALHSLKPGWHPSFTCAMQTA